MWIQLSVRSSSQPVSQASKADRSSQPQAVSVSVRGRGDAVSCRKALFGFPSPTRAVRPAVKFFAVQTPDGSKLPARTCSVGAAGLAIARSRRIGGPPYPGPSISVSVCARKRHAPRAGNGKRLPPTTNVQSAGICRVLYSYRGGSSVDVGRAVCSISGGRIVRCGLRVRVNSPCVSHSAS